MRNIFAYIYAHYFFILLLHFKLVSIPCVVYCPLMQLSVNTTYEFKYMFKKNCKDINQSLFKIITQTVYHNLKRIL